MTGLTVFSVIRNGVGNGYPFVEAYASWLRYSDRVFVLDGNSTDGTREVLRELARLDERFSYVSRPWPGVRAGGSSIAAFTNEALELARVGAERLMYVQADEIYTPDQRRRARDWREGALEFAGCINFWNSLTTVVSEQFPMTYVRLFPAGAGARSIGDGFSFELGETPRVRLDEYILHYGWCFPVNILQKHVSHSRIYGDQLGYRLRGRLAALMLAQRRYDLRLLNALAPQYTPRPFMGEHPVCVRHLLGARAYDPYVGLGLLRAGAAW